MGPLPFSGMQICIDLKLKTGKSRLHAQETSQNCLQAKALNALIHFAPTICKVSAIDSKMKTPTTTVCVVVFYKISK